jgi:hypothetical protein
MATSPIYGWPEPDNTSLVKNGAQAMRDLGNAIDTTMGTMVAKTVVDAKGDLIAGTAADTVNRLAVGSNGETLVADSSTSTGLRWQNDFSVGRNKIINGDFTINQRNFTSSTSASSYTFDRWLVTLSGATATYSAQAFTPGTAPVAGYEGTNFARLAVTVGNDNCRLEQKIEDVRTLAGQTVTLSFWAKGTNPTTAGNLKATVGQDFGTGGSTFIPLTQTFILTANWTRYSLTFNLGSLSGKTIGTSSNVSVKLEQGTDTSTDAWTLDVWGVQLEAGSVATAFQTATGTLQGELAACQRYYFVGGNAGAGIQNSSSTARFSVPFPVTMRVAPTVTAIAAPQAVNPGVTESATGSQTTDFLATATGGLVNTVAASKVQFGGFSTFTDGKATVLLNNALSFSAEL